MSTISIQQNVENVLANIDNAAEKSGRTSENITLIAVTKTHDPEFVLPAYHAGITHFGENRIQEAEEKIPQLSNLEITWHMMGHLQRNKAKNALQLFHEFHALDSKRLAKRLQKQLEKLGIESWPTFIQVNVSGEESKYGIEPSELAPLLELIGENCPGLSVKGLMTVAPFVDDEAILRENFRRLRELRDKNQSWHFDHINIQSLSMGMTNDYEYAIEEGATHVRIGRAIFGEREGY